MGEDVGGGYVVGGGVGRGVGGGEEGGEEAEEGGVFVDVVEGGAVVDLGVVVEDVCVEAGIHAFSGTACAEREKHMLISEG